MFLGLVLAKGILLLALMWSSNLIPLFLKVGGVDVEGYYGHNRGSTPWLSGQWQRKDGVTT